MRDRISSPRSWWQRPQRAGDAGTYHCVTFHSAIRRFAERAFSPAAIRPLWNPLFHVYPTGAAHKRRKKKA
jgi:hypothetical protein